MQTLMSSKHAMLSAKKKGQQHLNNCRFSEGQAELKTFVTQL